MAIKIFQKKQDGGSWLGDVAGIAVPALGGAAAVLSGGLATPLATAATIAGGAAGAAGTAAGIARAVGKPSRGLDAASTIGQGVGTLSGAIDRRVNQKEPQVKEQDPEQVFEDGLRSLPELPIEQRKEYAPQLWQGYTNFLRQRYG